MIARLALAGLVVLAACGAPPERVVVFAAASTADVVQTVLDSTAIVSVGATSTLARQIDQGAPADVFVAADPNWVDWLRGRGHDVLEVVPVATGRLVVVGPVGAAALPVGGLEDASLRIALADPSHVPAGRYALRALRAIGVAASVQRRVVRMGDVRAALAAVETGAVDRAIVYASDALASHRVEVVYRFDPALVEPEFVVAVLEGERGRDAARRLVESPAWVEAGFGPPR